MSDAKMRTQNLKNIQHSDFLEKTFTKEVFWVAQSEFEVKITKLKMADPEFKKLFKLGALHLKKQFRSLLRRK